MNMQMTYVISYRHLLSARNMISPPTTLLLPQHHTTPPQSSCPLSLLMQFPVQSNYHPQLYIVWQKHYCNLPQSNKDLYHTTSTCYICGSPTSWSSHTLSSCQSTENPCVRIVCPSQRGRLYTTLILPRTHHYPQTQPHSHPNLINDIILSLSRYNFNLRNADHSLITIILQDLLYVQPSTHLLVLPPTSSLSRHGSPVSS